MPSAQRLPKAKKVWVWTPDNENNGFIAQFGENRKPWELSDSGSTINLWACKKCALLRGGQATFQAARCECAHPTSAHRTFSLVDLRDRTPGSKLDVYRSRILQRLKKNQTFFFHWFLESQKRRTRPGRQRILHVPIEVAEKTIKLPSGEVVENGVHVGKIRFRSFGSQEPEKDMLQIEALNEWKNRIVRDRHSEMAIGIVFDFRVYCPEIMVYFGVIMGFKLKKERFRELLKTPRQRPKGRLSKAWWWRENIFSEPGHPLERPSNDPLQIRYANRREAAPPPLMA